MLTLSVIAGIWEEILRYVIIYDFMIDRYAVNNTSSHLEALKGYLFIDHKVATSDNY